jgi:signal transduction histidine kinase
MDYLCPWENARFLIFSSNVPSLLFYSHIPTALIALFIGFAIFLKNKKSSYAIVLLQICGAFFLWSFFDLILWATNRPDMVMFFWSLQILIEPLIYILSFYLTHLFITQEDLKFKEKLYLSALYTPIVLLLPTHFNLLGVDLNDCTAIENFIARYITYAIEIICIIAIAYITIIFYRKKSAPLKKKETVAFGLGIILFLIAFSWGNLIGSFSDNWILAQIGLIGMPIFIAFLAYLIVSYKEFNLKLIGSEGLVASIWLLIVSIIFIKDISSVRIIVTITLIVFTVMGILLIRSVKREVKQREKLEILDKELESANIKLKTLDQARAEFITIASHQLRTPPATIKWYLSAVLGGDYGNIPAEAKEPIEKAQRTNNGLISLIDDMLNVSRIERGKMEFLFQEASIEKLVGEIYEQLMPMAVQKNLSLTYTPPVLALPKIMADSEKIKQVINNMVDNALKYTKKGEVALKIYADMENIHFEVKDTGKGFDEEEEKAIFEKYMRGKESQNHSAGLGLGMYVAKAIIQQHHGKIWAESQGFEKGSTFIFTLPIKNNLKATTLLDLTTPGKIQPS